MNYKAPPAFRLGDNYSDWKLDIELLEEFSSLEKKKQGPALLLELKDGKVKDAVGSLGKALLSISWVPKVNMGTTKIIKNTKFYEKMRFFWSKSEKHNFSTVWYLMVLIIRLEKQYKLSRTMVMTLRFSGCDLYSSLSRAEYLLVFLGVSEDSVPPAEGPLSVKHCWTGTQGGTKHPVLLGYCLITPVELVLWLPRCVEVPDGKLSG